MPSTMRDELPATSPAVGLIWRRAIRRLSVYQADLREQLQTVMAALREPENAAVQGGQDAVMPDRKRQKVRVRHLPMRRERRRIAKGFRGAKIVGPELMPWQRKEALEHPDRLAR